MAHTLKQRMTRIERSHRQLRRIASRFLPWSRMTEEQRVKVVMLLPRKGRQQESTA